MYLGYQNNKIKFYTQEPLDVEMYNLDKVVPTYDEYVLNDDCTEYVKKDAEWEQHQTEKRREDFYNNFLETSLGNYRLKPKGYANAQQTIDTVNNSVNIIGTLTEEVAELVIFYATPDFTKPEECTEEWLVAHQSHPKPMTKEQWGLFYLEFTKKYALAEYQRQAAQSSNIG